MADYIPFDIQEEIIKRIPDVKSLIRFRSVSKPWKSLIDSSKFIADFHVTHTRPHDVLLAKHVSILDDDNFPKHKSSVPAREFVKLSQHLRFVGSSQGLFCFYDFRMKTAVLWNPTIRKSVDIVVPNVLADFESFKTVVGFGDCPQTRDPMLVKINYICNMSKINNISYIPWQVEVFTLSSRTWRSPSCTLPRKSISWRWSQIVIDGFIYWLVYDWNRDSYFKYHVMSFDTDKEEFADIYLPRCLTSSDCAGIIISKLKGALVVLEIDYQDTEKGCGVWVMNHGQGVRNSFKKCFTIGSCKSIVNVLGFRKSGEAIIGRENESGKFDLVLYEPCSKRMNDIGFSVNIFSCLLISNYMETLLLLDF